MIRTCSLLTFALAIALPSLSAQNILAVSDDSAYRVNSLSGAITLLGPTGFDHLRSFPKLGNSYQALNWSGWLIDVDPATGSGSLVTAVTPAGSPVVSIAGDPTTGLLYGLDTNNPPRLRRIDPATGVATLVGSAGIANSQLRCLAIDANGEAFAWHPTSFSAGLGRVKIDLVSGIASDVNPFVGSPISSAVQMAFAGETMFGAGGQFTTIDTKTGELFVHANEHPPLGAFATFTLPIPNASGVSGAQLFLQAISIDTGAPAELVLTQPLVATID